MATRRKTHRTAETDPDELVSEVTAGIVRLQRRKRRVRYLKRLALALALLVLGVSAVSAVYWSSGYWTGVSWQWLWNGVPWPVVKSAP